MLLSFIIPFAGHNFFVLFFCQLRNFFEHAVQLPFTEFLYSPFPDNYAFLSLSPSQIKNVQSADTVPVHGHSPLVRKSKCVIPSKVLEILESTGGICWLLWFSIRYAASAAIVRRDFRRLHCKRKTTPARFTKFAGCLHWGVSFSGTEISLILGLFLGGRYLATTVST